MVLRGIALHRIAWHCIAFDYLLWYCMVFYCFAWYFIDYTVLIWRAGELPRSASSHFIIYLEVPVSRNLTLVVSADF